MEYLVEGVSSGEATPAEVAKKLATRLCGIPMIPREAYVALLLGVSRGERSGSVAECVAMTAGEVCVNRGGEMMMLGVLIAISSRGECVPENAVSVSVKVGGDGW